MNRLGWIILVLILLGVGAFASMIRVTEMRVPAPGRAAGEMRSRPPAPDGMPDGVLAGQLAIPVAGVAASALSDTWGDGRAGGARRHQAIDIAAPRGTPVRAAASGMVEKLFDSRDGGRTLYIRTGDRRWSHYYAHLDGYAPGIGEGRVVRRGATIGYVGDSGNAGAGNTHLHFAVARMRRGDRWWQGEPVNPYPLLAGNGARR